MQLFFIPLIIVAILVGVWMMFSWLAHMGSRPDQLIRNFERINDGTWQDALTLANMLRDPSNDSVRRDSQLAARLASFLDGQTETDDRGQEQIWLRMYLARALGEFYVPDGLPALLNAARQADSVEAWQVRRAALEAIGLLTDHVGARQVEQNANLLPVLTQIAQQQGQQPEERQARDKLRATVAFVLGLLESDASGEALIPMLSDPAPLVRYNAAAGLARRGDPRALPRLLEMLDPDNPELLAGQTDAAAADDGDLQSEAQWNRMHIIRNALRAATKLAEQNKTADLSALTSAVNRLLQHADVRGGLRIEAEVLSHALADRRPVVPAP
jgi:HEAT repeat protein